MNLYTSSSERRILLTTLLATCATVVLGYHLLVVNSVVGWASPMLVNGRLIPIQRYALSAPDRFPVVLIGSSWLRVVARSRPLPDHWYDLCIPGSSATDGCDAILLSGRYPKTLLVEASERLRNYAEGDHPAQKAISPSKLISIKVSPIFREQYKPVAVLLSGLHLQLHSDPTPEAQAKRKVEIVNKLRDSLPSRFVLADLRASAKTLKKKLLQLKAHGVRILLLRLPRDMEVQSTRSVQITDEALMKVLPETAFAWYTAEQFPWKTTDGGHLTKDSARQYSIMLEREVQKRGLE